MVAWSRNKAVPWGGARVDLRRDGAHVLNVELALIAGLVLVHTDNGRHFDVAAASFTCPKRQWVTTRTIQAAVRYAASEERITTDHAGAP